MRGERRRAAKPRIKVPAKGRARGARVAPRAASKLHAAHRAGLSPPAVLAAGLMVLALATVAVLATGGRGQRALDLGRSAIDSHFANLGFRLGVVHLQGASPSSQKEIMRAAALTFGAPILTIDLDKVRRRVERVGWVERARIVRLLPDTLVIAVNQRPLLAVWQHGGGASVIAADGHIVNQVDPAKFSALPLIVGAGANLAAGAMLPSILQRPRLVKRLDALVRVDGRRWDIRLKDNSLIMLPAQGEETALKRLDSLDRSARIFDMGLARVDLRDPAMVVVRPRAAVVTTLTKAGV